jgi:hypothetical protein
MEGKSAVDRQDLLPPKRLVAQALAALDGLCEILDTGMPVSIAEAMATSRSDPWPRS